MNRIEPGNALESILASYRANGGVKFVCRLGQKGRRQKEEEEYLNLENNFF